MATADPLLQVFAVLPSTNDSILQAGGEGAPEGTTHLALAQTRGRGRAGRTWWSPAGAGLWMSVLLCPQRRREAWGALSLITGAAVHEALAELGVRGVELCWPNDLVAGDRKLGGILCEVRSRGDRTWIAAGIGINIDFTRDRVRRSMPPEIRERAISLVEAGSPSERDPVAVARVILRHFWPLYRRFLAGTSVAALAGGKLACRDRPVEVSLPDGEVFQGLVAGLGEAGELLLRSRGGKLRTVVAGDVTFLDTAAAPGGGLSEVEP